MSADNIDLRSLLRFDQEEGHIWLKSYRMLLMSARSLGAVRRELIETLGFEGARGVMKRFGHAAGLADGIALQELFPEASKLDHHMLGANLHGLEGVAKVVLIPERTRIAPEKGELHIEAYWENSYESEQHLELFGRSDEPVCWTLSGYATGHSSSAAGDRTVVVETECQAMGHDRCRFVVDYARNMPEEARREERDYEKHALPDVLQELVNRVKDQSHTLLEAERKVSRLEDELNHYRPAGGMIGHSPKFEEALTTAKTVAPVDATVLILGESGTGKEGLARFIHDQSLRTGKPFIAVNCSALPETLQEAELFGYAKGAFTGASAATPGLFEAAHRGTLFLDEIGDLAPTAQTKILRALQEGEIKRLGETRTRRVDVRVVAATHRDLKGMVREKAFREDLYYRLNVITIPMPPLQERGHDRLLLAEHFLKESAERLSRPVTTISREARSAILAYNWPGNVRELQNALERAVIMSENDEVNLEDLPVEVHSPGSDPERITGDEIATPDIPAETLEQLQSLPNERARIQRALDVTEGNRERAAEILGMSRTTLWRRMKKRGLL
ncbi:MAG: two-component system response regulator HydG [Gammaproteobacteria bacterium]